MSEVTLLSLQLLQLSLNSQHMFTSSVTLKGVNSKFTTSFKSLVMASAQLRWVTGEQGQFNQEWTDRSLCSVLKCSWLKPLLCDGRLFICHPVKPDLLDCAVEGSWWVYHSGCRDEERRGRRGNCSWVLLCHMLHKFLWWYFLLRGTFCFPMWYEIAAHNNSLIQSCTE